MVKWTKDQQAAINAPKDSSLPSQTLLVAAAAGSGKTAVLVERIISRLKDKENPLSIQELMVVTFTKAAAAEMSTRIGVALAKELEKTGDTALERQLNLLPSAHISTLHSFCQWVIRSYFYHLDINPSFRIGNEGEMQLLKQEVLDNLLQNAYGEDRGEAVFHIYELADMFSDDKSDTGLENKILRLYHYAMAQSNPNGWLLHMVDVYKEIETVDLVDTMWGRALWADQQERIEGISQRYSIMQSLVNDPAGPLGWQDKIDESAVAMDLLKGATDWQSMYEAIQTVQTIKFSQYRKTKDIKNGLETGTMDPGIVSRVETLGKQNKELLQDMGSGIFSIDESQWKEQIAGQIPIVEGLVNLTIQFRTDFEAKKQEQGLLDFSDLEHLCLQLLVEPGTEDDPKPSAVALELQHMFKEVMVDEYQDTNGVQEAIVNLVSKRDNRFYVGDVKQSIYGFRMADSTLFMNKYKTYGGVDDVERRIDLAQNFRSHENILAVTNFIFYQIMTETAAELNYGERELLVPGRTVTDAPAEWVGGPVEMHLVDVSKETLEREKALAEQKENTSPEGVTATYINDDSSEEEPENNEREMAMIIEKILELKENGAMVQEKDGSFRLMEWRDIVILKRSIAGQGNRMVEAMRNVGIPAYVAESSGYFEALEIQLMLSLLSIIDNPEQDLPMAAVLHSGLVGLNANELGQLRLLGTESLWSLLPQYGAQTGDSRILQFIEELNQWRTLSRRRGVSELLWDIYERTDYVNYVGAMPNGLVRRANVLALYGRAKEYEAASFKGLFRFLRFVESLRDAGQDLSVANVVSEADNVVRIMTIHKSKGLEFPVVFLSGIQKGFNMRDLTDTMLLHKEAGMGLKGYYPEYRITYPSLPFLYCKQVISLAMKAEEQRILYVALTRARDKLFITGHTKDFASKCSKLGAPAVASEDQSLSKDLITSGNSYLDWFIMSFARHLEGGNLIRQCSEVETVGSLNLPDKRCSILVELHDGANYGVERRRMDDDNEFVEAVQKLASVPSEPLPEHIVQRFDFHYDNEGATKRFAKISVSELKRRFLERDLEAIEVAALETAKAADLENLGVNTASVIATEDVLKDTVFGRKPVLLNDNDNIFSGAQWGTLMHEAMQWLPVKEYTLESITAELDELVRLRRFTQEERELLNERSLYTFFESSLGQRLIKSKHIEKELPFSMLLEGHRVYEDLKDGEELFLQGIVDTVFEENGAWVLVDYKTDRVKSEKELIHRYRIQMDLYKEALQRLTGMDVKESYIYSFRLHKAILV